MVSRCRRVTGARSRRRDPSWTRSEIIDRIVEEDKRRPAKQRHTSKRIFERLRDEHGFAGELTIVKHYVHERRLRQREVFVPLRHDPGHAQVDPRIKSEGMLREALAEIGGVEQKIHFFAFDLPGAQLPFERIAGKAGSRTGRTWNTVTKLLAMMKATV